MRRLAWLVLLPVLVAGCDTSNYAFKIDESIEILKPQSQAFVSIPAGVKWTDSKPPSAPRVDPKDPSAEYYAVFVDAAPIGPGKHLSSLVVNSERCKISAGCPSEAQLKDARVHLVAKPSLLLEFIADRRPTSRGNSKDLHELTIVRMRGDTRVGETAFRRSFFVAR